ncbi:nucleotide pyrophosphohydrolase [Mycoplasma marinum]|uniref:Nucleotide pyrophosphohydrolase n=1 Tax=Mycoplasma marinum TaxID=1937190 RepID=A0A4R0XL02_9MOLU|nr:nucleotide pyrophosphohydrolase [Mycoplasma marinum]TCG11336.1 nucleotide pyrophosphohydrolase [Mycoplasma marinum]
MSKKLIEEIVKFRNERDWEDYPSGISLAYALSLESEEILELFSWEEKPNKYDLENQISNVASYLYLLAYENNIDIEKAILKRIKEMK